MKSMTGFSFVESPGGGSAFRVDVKGYNNRYREIFVNLPGSLGPLEPEVREILGRVVQRGKVEVYIRWQDPEAVTQVRADLRIAGEYQAALETIQRELGMAGQVSLDHLIAQEGVLRRETAVDLDQIRGDLLPLVEEAAAGFDGSRQREGEQTARDIEGRLGELDQALALFREKASEVEALVRRNLQERFQEVLAGDPEDPRLLSELAVLLVRYSTNEEIARLEAHLEAFRGIAGQPEAVGKKLDFLCQEIGREINTIGSKTPLVEVQHGVVRAKDALENMREQLRNVE